MTPAEAAQRKSEILATPEWRDKYLSGGITEANELRDLDATIAKGDNPEVDLAMAGNLDGDPFQMSDRRKMIGTAQMLRDAGIEDGAIRNTLLGKSVSQQDHQAAQSQKAALLRSSDFTTKFMAGDGEAKKQMLELDMILSSPVAAS
jgi:hypothetical protein